MPDAALTWRPAERWRMLSRCGRYSITKAVVEGRVKYSAWRLKDKGCLGVTNDAGEAKRLAQRDHESTT